MAKQPLHTPSLPYGGASLPASPSTGADRPHQVQVQIALTNWLEMALGTELVEGIGAPGKERQDNLLNTAHELCFSHAASLPVTNNFLLELMPFWNYSNNFKKVMRLQEHDGFTSMESLCYSVLRVVE
ncbi:hypothetical protein E2C01_000026 [Portunus trituberculatus]|uniref:Uncharacterized protein n=1 Tax=Portunus trituberculatus TaxID=210409 RepID=A0A5B7CF85_PORTR|nr:hypothetical protein [Portunus trituberculatus]